MEVRCDTAAPSAVRDAMSSLRGLGWVLGDAMLIASELVTSVIRRAGVRFHDRIEVDVSREGETIAISVSDPSGVVHTPAAARIASADVDAFGMLIVDRLSRRWGTQRDGGYQVWAELPLQAAA